MVREFKQVVDELRPGGGNEGTAASADVRALTDKVDKLERRLNDLKIPSGDIEARMKEIEKKLDRVQGVDLKDIEARLKKLEGK
jgi:polyhydroxyalkanoate synthesis regulator phasin